MRCFNSSIGRAQGWKPWGYKFESYLKHIKIIKFLIKKYKIIKISKRKIILFLNIINIKNQQNVLKMFYVFKLSQFFKKMLLIDIISYNNITHKNKLLTIYIFKKLPNNFTFYLILKNNKNLLSLSTLFPNSIWFERENKEFFNISFLNALDNRNLLLPYLNTEFPLLKSYPVSGFKELFYNNINNTVNYTNITIQI